MPGGVATSICLPPTGAWRRRDSRARPPRPGGAPSQASAIVSRRAPAPARGRGMARARRAGGRDDDRGDLVHPRHDAAEADEPSRRQRRHAVRRRRAAADDVQPERRRLPRPRDRALQARRAGDGDLPRRPHVEHGQVVLRGDEVARAGAALVRLGADDAAQPAHVPHPARGRRRGRQQVDVRPAAGVGLPLSARSGDPAAGHRRLVRAAELRARRGRESSASRPTRPR